jgi:hypothetical protein
MNLRLFYLLALVLVLSACNTANNTKDNLYILSGNVVGYTGGDAVVEALWNGDSYGSGSIKSDGSFRITLENPIGDSRLMGLESELDVGNTCSSLEISSTDSKGTVLPVLTITKKGQVLGYIGQVSSIDMIGDLNETNYTTLNAKAIGRVYANENATVMGMCQDDAVSVDLSLKAGWNSIYINGNGKGQASLSSTGQNLSWHYLAQE